MKKSFRVKKEKEFQKVFQIGKSMANRQFVVYQLKKHSQQHFRVGISVSKKLGKAVQRNYIKRKIRHCIKELTSFLSPDMDIIIIARMPVIQMSYHELKQSLIHVLKLSKLLPKDFK